jgi:hypothetical protein
MIENLAEKGIKRKQGPPAPDLVTVFQYHPEAVCALGVVAHENGMPINALFIEGVWPDWLVSAYRDKPADASVLNSPHYFGVAFDICVGSKDIQRQIDFLELATKKLGLFNRGGIYVGRNTCHIDQCDEAWMRKFNGTKYWVWHDGVYTGFTDLTPAATFALKIVLSGGAEHDGGQV